MPVKTNTVGTASESVGLNIHKAKTKILKYNMENTNPITLDSETLEEMETFTYLNSNVDER